MATTQQRTDHRTDHRVTFAVLCVGVGSFSLLQSMVTPVLATIERGLDTDQATVTWVLTAYLLSASVFTPIVGRVGDKVGKERMLVVALGALAVGSLLAVGGGIGLVVAGPIVDALSYHWLFWLPMILTATAAVTAHFFVPESPERAPGRINVGTALLMSAWLVALLLAVSQGHSWGWGSPTTVGLFVVAAVVLPVWVWAEARSDSPLIDMTMMRIPTVWTVNLVSLLFGMGMYSMFAFLPQFLQTPDEVTGYGFGASVTESGLLLLPQTVATFVAGLASGRLAARYGSKAMLVAGATLTSLGTLGIVLAHDHVWQLLVESTVLGLAFGLAFAAMSNLVVDAVPQTQTGVASGMNANIRTVGGALGGAVLASVVTAGHRPDGFPVESGYTHGFTLLVVTSALAALVALAVPVVKARTHLVPGPQADAESALVAGASGN
jgi:MFS family permease